MSRITYLERYHAKVRFTVDDGTGTIEYAFRLSDGEGEGKLESKASKNRDVCPPSVREPTDGFAKPPKPLIPVGSVVSVQGKVRVKHNSRELYGETIGPCSIVTPSERILLNDSEVRCRGLREELEHWQRVTALHKNHYFLPERFVIPSLSSINAAGAQDTPRTPKSTNVIASLASTPSTYSTTSSSTTSSPTKSSEGSSVRSRPPQLITPRISDLSICQLLPRLRHPSRLRSRDLTENTFRIYVKHFMDNLRYLNFGPNPSESDLEDSDTDSIDAAIDNAPMTPTKKKLYLSDELTPRLSHSTSALLTPRPRPNPGSASRLDRSGYDDDDRTVVGCTLSFLLRVPELSNLARRVVRAEMRRREKTRGSQSQAQSGAVNHDTSREQGRVASSSSTEGSLLKVKRLFSWAIRKLYQDGSIIIWDGPTISVSVLEPHMALDSSMLYRSSRLDITASSSSGGPLSRLFSRHGGNTHRPVGDDSIEDLSDPPSDEEAYASLSTAYLAMHVEQVIRSLMALQSMRRKREDENTYMGPAISRKRLLPLPGPTKKDITTHLKRGDDRWKRINGWAVQEALEWLRDNGRVWCVSEDDGGRWELCS